MSNNIEHHNSLSFLTLHAKFHSHHHEKKTTVNLTESSSNPNIAQQKKKNSYTMPRRLTDAAKNLSHDISDHFPIKRNHSDIPCPKTTPSLWSSSNSSTVSTTTTEEETLNIRVVPRTGSFVTELSKRLAISEKKGETVSHILPHSASMLSLSRRSAPATEITEEVTPAPHHIRKSVPNSTSSSSMALPSTHILKRSTTGTSIHSIISVSSISTNQSGSTHHSKKWVPHWSASPPLPHCEEPSRIKEPHRMALKRARVIQELIDTEKSYQADMELIQEIYFQDASEAFSKIEIKLIFINLLDIIAFEKDFVQMLDLACCEETSVTVGIAFSVMLNRMDQMYGEFCKKHQDAVIKIQELGLRPNVQAYFTKCKERLQGRTMCWDLPSLLIKPVQRVLKYPLLLKEVMACTPENHQDFNQLSKVIQEIQQMAGHINEMKRRKDIVEQLINDRKKMDRNLVQGINKKFTRRVHRSKKQSSDALFDNLSHQFETRQQVAHAFELSIHSWIDTIKQNIHALSDLVHHLETVYGGDSDGIGLRSMSAYKQLVSQISAIPFDMQHIFDRLEAYLKHFENPSHIIQKRNRKLVDYDRYMHLMSKGEAIDKQLQISAEQYVSLNEHLLDELPTFLSLTVTYFDIIMEEFAGVQASYWRKWQAEWKNLTIQSPFGKEHTWAAIEAGYLANMKRIQPRINDISLKPEEMEKEGTFLENDSGYSLDQIPSLLTSSDEDPSHPVLSSPPLSLLTPSINNNDSLFSESQPVFQCIALENYESPERFQVNQGDLIHIWLPTSDMGDTTEGEWWYGSLASPPQEETIYGWLPSTICEKIQ